MTETPCSDIAYSRWIKDTMDICGCRVNITNTFRCGDFQYLDVLIQSPDRYKPSDLPEIHCVYSKLVDNEHIDCVTPLCTDELPKSEAAELLYRSIKRVSEQQNDAALLIRYLLPLRGGYILRSDLLLERIQGCESLVEAVTFAKPGIYFQPVNCDEINFTNFLSYVSLSIGGIVFQTNKSDRFSDQLSSLNSALTERMSLNCILERPLRNNLLALVHGGGEKTRQQSLHTARALGIRLVVLDSPGTWMDNPACRDLCYQFIPVDLTLDNGLVDRLIGALNELGESVDGIISLSDPYLVATATVAKQLGLVSPPPEVFERAVDKGKTRLAEGLANKALSISRGQDVKAMFSSGDTSFKFPLIVKPAQGSHSRHVQKVSNIDQLEKAAEQIFAHKLNLNVLIEEYESGPEFDVNMAIWNKQVIFHEIVDDFPKPADAKDALPTDSFGETDMVLPSALHPAGQDFLRDAVHEKILSLGFEFGVFHAEVRLRHSGHIYAEDEKGIVDLIDVKHKDVSEWSMFLIELNARPPGSMLTEAVRHVYGIDYYALHMLFALDEPDLAIAAAQSFPSGPICWAGSMVICSERCGTLVAPDMFSRLRTQHPDAFALVRKAVQLVDDDTKLNTWPTYLAYLVPCVASSRRDLLILCKQIRAALE